MGGIAQAMYQDAAGSLTNSYYLFGAENLHEAAARSHAFKQLAGQTDAKIGRLQALETVAKSLKQKAEAAAETQANRANAAERATGDVAKRAADVDRQLKQAEQRREQLVIELAAKRNTDVAAERARAQQMEATRAQQATAQAAAVVAKAESDAVAIANAKIGETPAEPAVPVQPAADAAAEAARAAAEAQRAAEAQKRQKQLVLQRLPVPRKQKLRVLQKRRKPQKQQNRCNRQNLLQRQVQISGSRL
ncbi:hypothetical protein RQN30_09245 [Arcanobacterium hippocoleae]